MNLKEEQRRRVLHAKGATPESIPVLAPDGRPIGELIAIGGSRSDDYDLAALMCSWRREAASSFLTVFEPSIETTLGYIHKLAIKGEDRILFLLRASDGSAIGNIGLCNIDLNSGEIDNVLRGERPPEPGFMRAALLALCGWAESALGISLIYLNVLSDNDRAIESYSKAGFQPSGLTALKRVELPNGYKLIPAETSDEALGIQLLRMERRAL